VNKADLEKVALTGLRIYNIRQQRGIRLETLSAAVGISSAHLSNMESGRKKPSLEVLAAISRELDVSMDYLVFGVDEGWEKSVSLVLHDDVELVRSVIDQPRFERFFWENLND